MSKLLDTKARKQAFLQLVRLQDTGCSVSASQLQVAADFQITVSLLRMIELEGLRYEWPPLGCPRRRTSCSGSRGDCR